MSTRYLYPLSFQTVLPDDYKTNREFISLLELLRQLGFWGVELNLNDPKDHKFEDVCQFLGIYGLAFSMFATGLTARRLGLSLSSLEESNRRQAVKKCKEMIEWVRHPETGVILGFLKGGVTREPEIARRRFALSLKEIFPVAESRGVQVLVEATNRYETSVANTITDTAALLHGYDPACAQILPDTFHMNIEEPNMLAALREHQGRVTSLHLSDNNRRFPGFGAIDFSRVVAGLLDIGYKGRIAIEGNAGESVKRDLQATIRYLTPLLTA